MSKINKLTWMKWTAAIGAVSVAIILLIVGLRTPNIEETVAGNIGKYVFMWAWITAVVECLLYTLGQVLYDWYSGYKDQYGKGWFLAGIRDDIRWLKEHYSWKGFFKYVGIYILFFAAFFLVIFVLEWIFP